MNIVKLSFVACTALLSSQVMAESTAITHTTIYTATNQGVLTDATVVMSDGKITAINPATITADKIIDGKGKIVTPGLIGSMNLLGLVEINAVGSSRDGEEEKADITFDPSLAFNPMSSLISYTRKGGITSDIVVPTGGKSIFKGQSFVANLSGDFNSVEQANNAVYVSLGAKQKGSRAFDLQQLINALADRQTALSTDKKAKHKANNEKQPSRTELILNDLLAGKKPLIVSTNRASDILQLVKLKQRFHLDLIIAGAADAVVVAKQLAEAKIPVIIAELRDLPYNFDALHNSLDNAAKLAKAGVDIILSVDGEAHNLYQLRYDAGNAVSYGVPPQMALAAITANVADAFHLNTGKIAIGRQADVVLWSGDPFELSTEVTQMWIAGKPMSTQSREDKLRERYMTKSTLPAAYVK